MSAQRLALALLALAPACNTADDKKPPSVTLERSQVVAAKPGQVTTAAAPVTPAAASAAPKPPRVLCAGQMASPGRAAPKKPISQHVASGENELPETPALGGGFTWVNFWAAWCAPCKEEIPRLHRFEQEISKTSPGFKLTYISLDDDERQLTAFLAGQPASGGLRRTYWLKEGKEREDWLKAAGLDADPELPFHLLVDKQGKLRCVVKGALEDSDLPALRALVTP
jgi:thiol-disulfide isomerase/thioredoxin